MSITVRLDSLPLSRFHWKLAFFSGLVGTFASLDYGIATFVFPVLIHEWKLTPNQVGFLGSIGLLGMFFGAALAGSLADRYGRRFMLQSSLLLFSLATGVCALTWNFWSLLLSRFLVGLGLGGVFPVINPLIGEFSPPRYRGRLRVVVESFWAYGSVMAAAVAYLVIPRCGWRIAFLIGALPALYVLLLRRLIPESLRYLSSKGQAAQAESILGSIEAQCGVENPRPLTQLEERPARPKKARKTGFAELWRAPYLRRTLCLWVLWFCIAYSYYGMFTWLPSLLVARGYDIARSFGYLVIMALVQIPGSFSPMFFVDSLGRKRTLTFFLALAAISAYFFSQATDDLSIIMWGGLLSFFYLGAWGVIGVYASELYPTRVRATGTGWAVAFGRTGSILASSVVGLLIGEGMKNYDLVFMMFVVVLLIGALDMAILGEETKGRSLEALSE